MAFDLTAVLRIRNEMSSQLRQASDSLDATNNASSRLSGGLTSLAKVGIGAVVAGAAAGAAGIMAIGKSAVEAAADSSAMNAQFEQVFGELGPNAQKAIDGMGKEFDMASNRLKPAMSSMTSMFMGLGIDTEKSMKMATDALTASADASAFYDVSMEQAQGSLSSFLKGKLVAPRCSNAA